MNALSIDSHIDPFPRERILARRVAHLLETNDNADDPELAHVDVDEAPRFPVVSVTYTDGSELFIEVHDA